MPSAYSKTSVEGDMSSSNCLDGPFNNVLQILEKRVRNLEKRKLRLDGYRAVSEANLNDDQKSAVAKYDEVINSLDFANDLTRQLRLQAVEDSKNRKKLVKKENQDRNKADIQRLATILGYIDCLQYFQQGSKHREELLEGTVLSGLNISKERLNDVAQFATMLHTSDVEGAVSDNNATMLSKSEHLMCLHEGRNKIAVETSTYKDIKEAVCLLISSRLLLKFISEKATPSSIDNDNNNTEEDLPTTEIPLESSSIVNGAENSVDESETNEHSAIQQNSATIYDRRRADCQMLESNNGRRLTTNPEEHVIDAEWKNFNFLQESQIDLESPHMDPAVVMVHQSVKHSSGDHDTFVPTQPTYNTGHFIHPSTHNAAATSANQNVHHYGTDVSYYHQNSSDLDHKKNDSQSEYFVPPVNDGAKVSSVEYNDVTSGPPIIGDWCDEVEEATNSGGGGGVQPEFRNQNYRRGNRTRNRGRNTSGRVGRGGNGGFRRSVDGRRNNNGGGINDHIGGGNVFRSGGNDRHGGGARGRVQQNGPQRSNFRE